MGKTKRLAGESHRVTVFTVLDVNNFWSPTGGGVRRYHIEKMDHYAGHAHGVSEPIGAKLVFVMSDERTYTEQRAPNVIIEHVKAPHVSLGYRMIVRSQSLREVIRRHRPDVIEVGSPYILPFLVKRALRGMSPRPAVVGFWHADFPRAYVGRLLGSVNRRLGPPGEALAWRHARRHFGWMDAVLLASVRVAQNVQKHGLERLCYTPLGVHCERFDPARRDASLVEELRAGHAGRRTIFYPHRFLDEKGLRTLLAAYPKVMGGVKCAPALVFAGDGPLKSHVERAVESYEHVRYLGYLEGADEMARWYASCDLSVALSAFETFGLSAAEAMASGLALVGADEGAAAELIEDSGCGLTVPFGDVDALAQALTALIDSPDLGERGRRGRDHVATLTWQACFHRQLAMYQWVARRVASGAAIPAGLHLEVAAND